MEEVDLEMESARQKLLDLTMRNRLLNHRPYKRKSLRIVDEIPREIYNILVLEDKTMEFLPIRKEYNQFISEKRGGKILSADGEEIDQLLPSELIELKKNINSNDIEKIPERYIDKYLQTELDKEQLRRSLFNIYNNYRSFIEEQGYNVLYLAMGFLEWKEAPYAEMTRKAPLILIPVEISRSEKTKKFKVKWSEEEVLSNISLSAKLSEMGIIIPDFTMAESKDDIDNFLGDVQESITGQQGWSLVNDIYLDFFSFTKFIMYKDLAPDNWPKGKKPSENEIIKILFDSKYEYDPGLEISEENLKWSYNPKTSLQVVDADPSQMVVIEEAKNGKNIVVEGPPGTGKSQTITNIISELLAMNKTVLFVSQKMAALEVVKKRLDSVELGDFCFELHSRKTKKKDFYKELERQLKRNFMKKEDFSSDFKRFEDLSTELDNFSEVIKKEYGKLKKSPLEIINDFEEANTHFINNNRESVVDLKFQNPLNWTRVEYNDTINELMELEDIYKKVKPVKKNAWYGCSPKEFFQDDVDILLSHINKLEEDIRIIKRNCKEINKKYGIPELTSPTDLNEYLHKINLLLSNINNNEEVIKNREWNIKKAKDIISKFKKIFNKYKVLCKLYKHDIMDEKFKTIIEDIEESLCEYKDELLYWDIEKGTANDIIRALEIYNKETDYFIKHFGIDILTEMEGYKYNEYLLLNNKIFSEYRNWFKNQKEGNRYYKTLKSYNNKKKVISKFGKKEILLNIQDGDLNRLANILKKKLKYINLKYYTLKKNIVGKLYIKPTDDELYQLIQNILSIKEQKNGIIEKEQEYKKYFNKYWEGPDTDFKKIMILKNEITEEIDHYKELHKELEMRIGLELKYNKSVIILTHFKKRKENEDYIFYRNEAGRLLFYKSWNGIKSNIIELKEIKKDYLRRIDKHKDKVSKVFILKDSNAEEKYEELKKQIGKFNKFYKDYDKFIKYNSNKCKRLFGRFWKGIKSDVKEMENFIDWFSTYFVYRSKGFYNETSDYIIINNIDLEPLSELGSNVKKILSIYKNDYSSLDKKLDIDLRKLKSTGFKNVPFYKINELLVHWRRNKETIINWSQYISKYNKLMKTNVKPLIQLVNEDEINQKDITNQFIYSFSNQFLKSIFSKEEILNDFIYEIHEKRISDFKDIDKKILLNNRNRLKHKLYNIRPKENRNINKGSLLGNLKREINKKRRQKPIRQVISTCGPIIQKYKPCFMMSPLSIAQFIEPGKLEFDVIIFDEASQVKPEDALGAFFRGKQAIIMGDTKQLPPTTFFDNVLSDEDETEIASVEAMESILHLCKSSSFKTKMLKWHYRSNHETLINVSNNLFYDNELKIYPSSRQENEDLGLKFVHIPNSVYDIGKSSVNEIEANAVVDYAFNHYKKWGHEKSLGIGTFNIKQQKVIIDEIENRLIEDDTYWRYFRGEGEENFFVKNLETIQGDERDVILISVGYGFGPDGRLRQNFGPLNQEGGERRLNVLITRAKDKCVIFSNFKGGDLRVKSTESFGTKSLKEFLQYAEHKKFTQIGEHLEESESPFEESVFNFIREHGYEVHKQIGCAGFRVDLGIVNPKSRGEYVLGIECDGAKYHSALIARDRDRLRQEVLERMGWNIYRIWSTDWFRNRMDAENRLISVIEDVLRGNGNRFEKENEIIVRPRDKVYTEKLNLNVPDYKTYNKNFQSQLDLHEMSYYILRPIIIDIIDTEGPIIIDELIKRVCQSYGIKRSGARIKSNLIEIINRLIDNKSIIIKNSFLYPKYQKDFIVRKRINREQKNIDIISEDELIESIYITLSIENPIEKETLIHKSANIFGFQSVRENIYNRMNKTINNLRRSKDIHIDGEMVSTDKNLNRILNKYYIASIKEVPSYKFKDNKLKYDKRKVEKITKE